MLGVDAKAQAQIGYSMSASGSLFPPGVKNVALSTSLDATMTGVLSIDATASVCTYLTWSTALADGFMNEGYLRYRQGKHFLVPSRRP